MGPHIVQGKKRHSPSSMASICLMSKKQRVDEQLETQWLTTATSNRFPVDFLVSMCTFLNRRQLLCLYTVSRRFRNLLIKGFNTAPYLILDRFCEHKNFVWIAHSRKENPQSYLASSPLRLLEQLLVCKFIQFQRTEISSDFLDANIDYIKEITHVWTGGQLCVTLEDMELKPKSARFIRTCRNVVIEGRNLVNWLPAVLESDSLEQVSIWDMGVFSDTLIIDQPHILVKFLLRPSVNGKPRQLQITNILCNEEAEALVKAVEQKFLNATFRMSFSLTWAMLGNGWSPNGHWSAVPFCQNSFTTQTLHLQVGSLRCALSVSE